MAKRGPKNKPANMKIVGGTDRPDRHSDQAFPDLSGEATLPAAFKELQADRPKVGLNVLEVWNSKLAVYRLRGQSVVGFESALYQYCLLEVNLNLLHNSGDIPPAALVSAHRVYANEFYDTPGANVSAGGSSKDNPFANNGKKPR